MSEQIFTAHENCIYAGDPPLLTGNQSRLVAECSSPQRAAFIVRACNSHEALVALAIEVAAQWEGTDAPIGKQAVAALQLAKGAA